MAGHPWQTTEPDQNKAEPRELSPSGAAQGTLASVFPPHLCASSSPGPGGTQGQVRDPGKEPSLPRKEGEDRGHGG